MAKSDWVALCTRPANEYIATVELRRLQLDPYLPQCTRVWIPTGHRALLRDYPLFTGYVLLPREQFDPDKLLWVRGLVRHGLSIADTDGNPLPLRDEVVREIKWREQAGWFHESKPHKWQAGQVLHFDGALSGMTVTLLGSVKSQKALQVVTPLFGGTIAEVSMSSMK